MDLTVSKPVKILALILVVAGVGGIASLSLLGKSSSAASAGVPSVDQVRARAHARSHAAAPAKATPTRATTTPPVVHVRAPAAPRQPVVRKPATTVAADGLPIVLADALRAHRVVVVSIFDPQSRTDAISYAEARAGAGEAGAGFLGVSVLDDTVAGPLTAALPGGGLLPVPGLLVYRAPGTLVQRIDGFSDRDAVAQIALNARTAPAVPEPPASAAPTTAAAPPTTTP